MGILQCPNWVRIWTRVALTGSRIQQLAPCGVRRSRSAAQQYTACDLNHNGLLDSIDMDEMIGEALRTLPCKDSLTGTGTCTVVDVQRVINAVLTGTCRVGP